MNAEALQLYLVTNRYADSPEVFLAKIAAACENGVTMVQLREKSLTTHRIFFAGIKVYGFDHSAFLQRRQL